MTTTTQTDEWRELASDNDRDALLRAFASGLDLPPGSVAAAVERDDLRAVEEGGRWRLLAPSRLPGGCAVRACCVSGWAARPHRGGRRRR